MTGWNAVVTGASGFIGRHLVDLLLQQGFTVRCLDMIEDQEAVSDSPRSTFYQVDCAQFPALLELPVWADAHYVFHLAGVTQRLSLHEFRVGNVTPTQNLLRVLKTKRPQLVRFLFVSSQAAAGPARTLEQPVMETHQPQPIEAYGISKLEGERAVERLRNDLPITIVRPCSVYGPGDRDFLTAFRMLSRHIGIYPGCRDKHLSVIYVKDLVKGILQSARAQSAMGETYFLTHKAVTWKTLYDGIAKTMGKSRIELNIPQFFMDVGGHLGDILSKATGRFTLMNSQKIALSKPNFWICSPEKAQRAFDFKAETPLLEGLTQTYQWYKAKEML